ncbi:MAG: glycosyltransferase family 9 protein [Selenomonas sp.]|nr:glycosyltransferase family 9 protein [Selenomonas sp.]
MKSSYPAGITDYEEIKPQLTEVAESYRDVSEQDIQMCLEAFEAYRKQALGEEKFDTDVFQDQLDKVFEEAGYRQDSMYKRNEILLIIDSGVGDFINLSASIREIRRIYEDACIVLVCYPRGKALAETCPYVDEVFYNSREFYWGDFMASYEWEANFAAKLLSHRFDLCFVFGHYASSYLLAFMSGAKERISYGADNPLCQGHIMTAFYSITSEFVSVKLPNIRKSDIESDIYLGILDNFLRVPVKNRNKEIWLRPGEREELDAVIREKLGAATDKSLRIAIGIGGSSPQKHWPPYNYGLLMKKLLMANEGYRFLLMGGPDDHAAAEEIISMVGSEYAADFTIGFNLRQSAGIISNCACYIGNDTSTLHIAAVYNLPILTPNCYPGSLGLGRETIPVRFAPNNVPMVMALPKEPLPECAGSKFEYGCRIINQSHCITQVTPELMLSGFHLLREMYEAGIVETRYIVES